MYNDVVPVIEQLQSDHEGAATHMLLTRPDKFKGVIVSSPDADVFAILVHNFDMGLCESFFNTGRKIISMH